jgi:hypothetical protein
MRVTRGNEIRKVAIGERSSRVDSAMQYADFVLKVLSSAAILIGAFWTWYLFDQGGGNDWMINLDMQTEVLPYDDNFRLLVVHVHSKNPRIVSFDFGPKDGAYDLTFRKLGALKVNQIGNEDSGLVLSRVSLMPDDGIVWSPFAEFDDMRTLLVPKGTTVVVNAGLHVNRENDKAGEDYVAASKVVYIQ